MNNLTDQLTRSLRATCLEGIGVRESKVGGHVITLPFTNGEGYPIEIMVRSEGTRVTIDDGGIIAGNLFTLGQQAVDSPAFKLLSKLSRAYDFKIDFDRGVVAMSVPGDHPTERIMDLLKVIVTLITATPFIRVTPNRPLVGGQRLRTRIKKAYLEQQVLEVVEQNFRLSGDSVESWPIDFHWQIQTDHEKRIKRDVYVVALDLDVAEALQKAERMAGLALDTRTAVGDNLLRVIIDKKYAATVTADAGRGDALTAARFLERHKQMLKYSLYDFGDDQQRHSFMEESVGELMGDMGSEWRSLWLKKKPKTLPLSGARS